MCLGRVGVCVCVELWVGVVNQCSSPRGWCTEFFRLREGSRWSTLHQTPISSS